MRVLQWLTWSVGVGEGYQSCGFGKHVLSLLASQCSIMHCYLQLALLPAWLFCIIVQKREKRSQSSDAGSTSLSNCKPNNTEGSLAVHSVLGSLIQYQDCWKKKACFLKTTRVIWLCRLHLCQTSCCNCACWYRQNHNGMPVHTSPLQVSHCLA